MVHRILARKENSEWWPFIQPIQQASHSLIFVCRKFIPARKNVHVYRDLFLHICWLPSKIWQYFVVHNHQINSHRVYHIYMCKYFKASSSSFHQIQGPTVVRTRSVKSYAIISCVWQTGMCNVQLGAVILTLMNMSFLIFDDNLSPQLGRAGQVNTWF